MTDVRDIIGRGKELTGRKLRQAIESATGQITGGRGIRVTTSNGNTVVSLKGHQIIGGGGSGASFPGLVTAVVDGKDAPFNANYEVRALDNSLMPPIVFPLFITPANRPFNTVFVDFQPALQNDIMRIWALAPTPLVLPSSPDGGCLDFTTGVCTLVGEAGCVGANQQFFGAGLPCAIFDVIEHVKISSCPEPAAVASQPLRPPPVLSRVDLLN